MIMKYDVNVLLRMADDLLEAECEYHAIAVKVRKFDFDRYEYQRCLKYDTIVSCYSSALCDACRMVDADFDRVYSTAKAMRRRERRLNWQEVVSLGWRDEMRLIRYFARM